MLLAALLPGCGTPSKANIELRKQNQKLESQLAMLKRQNQLDQQVIQGLQNRRPTVPTLPATRLSELFTTHGIQFDRLTGGADLDPGKPGDEGLALYLVPVDQSGEKFKAAGAFDVQAFDLADDKAPLIGHWRFDLKQSMKAWNGRLLDYDYVLICPWQSRLPAHPDLTVRVTFLDELTQTPFTAERVVHVNLPPG